MTPAVPGSLSFRTVFGGPGVPGDVVEELKRLQHELRALDWDYNYDVFIMVGGDITVVDEPTALVRPRIMAAQRLVTGELRINSSDVLTSTEPRTMLRAALFEGLAVLAARAGVRDCSFDPTTDLGRLVVIGAGNVG